MWKFSESLQTKKPQIFQIIRPKHRNYDILKNTAAVDVQVSTVRFQSREKKKKNKTEKVRNSRENEF